jgi:hypothetical protein
MGPDEVEQMLYERAIKTKIRAPLPERLSNLSYSRIVTSSVVAGAALVCSLVMSRSTGASSGYGSQVADSHSNKPVAFHGQNGEPVPASLAMSPVGG